MALGSGSGGGGSARGIRAGAAFVELGAKDNLTAQLGAIMGKFMSFGKMVAGIGAAMLTGGLALGIAGITAAAGPLLDTIQELGKIQDVADAFGITGRAASGLFGVLGAVGGEFKENVEGIVQFSGTMEKALHGIGQGVELFDGLKVKAKELQGLAVDEQFYRVLGAIRQLPQPLQEAKLALLGGQDSMKQWQRLLSMSEQDVRSLADKLAFSNAELRQAADASQAYKAATQSVTRAWQQVAVAAAPVVKEIAQWVERGADGFTGWIKGRDAANILSEVWVRTKQGLYELQAFGEDSFSALWDYFAENAAPAIDVVKQLFAGLFKFLVGAFGKIFPIWTKYAAAGVAASLGTVASMMKTAGLNKEGDELFAAAKSIDPTKAAERVAEMQKEGDKDLAEAMKGFDREREKFADLLRAKQGNLGVGLMVGGPLGLTASGRAGERAAGRARLGAELAGVLGAGELQRRQAEVIDGMMPVLPAGMKAQMDMIGRSMGTFGGNADFIGRSMGGGGMGKQLLTELKKANQVAGEQLKAL